MEDSLPWEFVPDGTLRRVQRARCPPLRCRLFTGLCRRLADGAGPRRCTAGVTTVQGPRKERTQARRIASSPSLPLPLPPPRLTTFDRLRPTRSHSPLPPTVSLTDVNFWREWCPSGLHQSHTASWAHGNVRRLRRRWHGSPRELPVQQTRRGRVAPQGRRVPASFSCTEDQTPPAKEPRATRSPYGHWETAISPKRSDWRQHEEWHRDGGEQRKFFYASTVKSTVFFFFRKEQLLKARSRILGSERVV